MPDDLRAPAGGLLTGRWLGGLTRDVVEIGDRSGRVRRWSYSAAAAGDIAYGAAVIDLGYVVASFVWLAQKGRVRTWERKGLPGLSGRVPATADEPAWFRLGRSHRVTIDASGGVAVHAGDLRIDTRVTPQGQTTIVVPTRDGGWNATQKVAGESVTGTVGATDGTTPFDGLSWRDFTVGRQDRRTHWRWAAGAGLAGGSRVGLNLSTGMNEHPPGENLIWWDGVPQPVELTTLGPTDAGDFTGDWVAGGPDWHLSFEPTGVRAADENLLLVRSRYVQPIGRFTGTLPGPDGAPVEVSLTGVTEDHEARW